MRWSEEVLLVKEEMRRVLTFMLWHASWWEDRQMNFDQLPKAEEEGMRGYALRQAALRRALHADFTKQWKAVPSMVRKGRRHPEVSPELVKLTNTVGDHAEGRCESFMSFLEDDMLSALSGN
jgi:hypothetical protein